MQFFRLMVKALSSNCKVHSGSQDRSPKQSLFFIFLLDCSIRGLLVSRDHNKLGKSFEISQQQSGQEDLQGRGPVFLLCQAVLPCNQMLRLPCFCVLYHSGSIQECAVKSKQASGIQWHYICVDVSCVDSIWTQLKSYLKYFETLY